MAQNIVYVVDTAFLGRVSEAALGAGAIAGLYYVAIFMLGMGFGTGAQIIIARRAGEGNKVNIGNIVDHSLYFLLAFACLVFVVIKFWSSDFLNSAISSTPVYNETIEYLDYRAYGIFFAFVNVVFRAFYVGIGNTNVLIWSTSLMAVVNIVLDYCLIFGNWSFPEMGIGGAALASVISEAAATIYFILHIAYLTKFKSSIYKAYQLFRFEVPQQEQFKIIFNVGLPVMIQNFISLGGWFAFYLIIEQMGERPLAISNIIRSIYLILMIPAIGFFIATHTLVSNTMGQNKLDEVVPLVKRTILLALVFTVVVMQVSVFFPEEIIGIYTDDVSLIAATLPVLYIITIVLLLLPASLILFGAVTGTGNTITALIIEVTTIAIYLVSTYLFVIEWKLPIDVVWYNEFLYLFLLGAFSFLYLKFGDWRAKKV